jgi:putative hydroxymethylpyrimidine transport system substrate-binding protein
MRPFCWLGFCLACLLLGGCGSGSDRATTEQHPERHRRTGGGEVALPIDGPEELQSLGVTLAGREGPEDLGALQAYHRDFLERPNLRVGIAAPHDPTRPISYVVEEVDQIGVSHEPEVALAEEKGLPIIAVGSVVSRPTATMIWLKKSNIHDISDLKGKTIAIPGLSFQRDMLEAILARAGIASQDVEIAEVGYGLVPSLESGLADAIFGGSRSVEGVALESRGFEPIITPVTRLGVPPYEELVWITRTDLAARHPQAIRNFIAAARRGTAAALAKPKEAVRILNESPGKVELSPKEIQAGVKAALPYLSRSAHMSASKARRLLAWMHEQGFIQRQPPPSAILTNRYLPRPAGS